MRHRRRKQKKSWKPSDDDSLAVALHIGAHFAAPSPSVPEPRLEKFRLTATDLTTADGVILRHKLKARRASLGFVLGGAVLLFLLPLVIDTNIAWVVLTIALAFWIGSAMHERIVAERLKLNPFLTAGLASDLGDRVTSFRRAKIEWDTHEKNRLFTWRKSKEPEARAAIAAARMAAIQQAQFWTELSGHEFEQEMGRLFEEIGYEVQYTPPTRDEGVDLILRKSGKIYIVQCKQHAKPAGPHFIRDLFGTMHHRRANHAVLVCTGGFSEETRRFAEKNKNTLTLFGLDDILKWANRRGNPEM